jgi:hypothetical protein
MDEVLQIALERPITPLATHAPEAPIRTGFPPEGLSDQESITH